MLNTKSFSIGVYKSNVIRNLAIFVIYNAIYKEHVNLKI